MNIRWKFANLKFKVLEDFILNKKEAYKIRFYFWFWFLDEKNTKRFKFVTENKKNTKRNSLSKIRKIKNICLFRISLSS